MRVKYELELESQMNHGHEINDIFKKFGRGKCYLTMNVIEVDE